MTSGNGHRPSTLTARSILASRAVELWPTKTHPIQNTSRWLIECYPRYFYVETQMKRILILLVMVSFTFVSSSALAKDEWEFPEYTIEGLKRVPNPESLTVVYAEPGANLTQYKRVYLVEPLVAFKKNWQSDQNRNLGINISTSDMERGKKAIAELFMDVFTKELEDGGYHLTHERADDVLIVKPAILNLDLDAPDTMRATIGRTYTKGRGSMTLYIELYDSETEDLLAKAMDKRVSRNNNYMYLQSRPAISQKVRRMMTPWAVALRKGLDRAHQETGEEK